MNKLIISIIAIVILAAGVGTFFALQKPAFPEPQKKPTTSPEQISKDSPFGFHAKYESPAIESCESLRDIREVGAKWVRFSGAGGLTWDGIETEKGKYDWSITDYLFSQANKEGLLLIVTIEPIDRFYSDDMKNPSFMPKDWAAYERFLKTAIERYDGDGIDDAPGSPVVNYWQISNEIDGFRRNAPDAPDGYAPLLKKSYLIIKGANSNAKVLMAGMAGTDGLEYYRRIWAALDHIKDGPDARYFDIFDFHWYETYRFGPVSIPNLPRIPMDRFIDVLNENLAKYGYKDTPIWMTETGVWSDKPPQGDPRPEKTEIDQAQHVIKVYVHGLAHNVEKILWFTLRERNINDAGQKGEGGEFGLIYNPSNKHGLSHRKLGYYTYKLMTEKLEGSDWNNIQTIQEKDGIYIYKFTKQGKSIWVAWNDNKEQKEIIISGINSNQAKTTQAVPKYESGKEVKDYNTVFNTEIKSVIKGKVSLTLAENPVFIEEKF